MAKTIVGLMETEREGESVVRALMGDCGCDRDDIGLMARGIEGQEIAPEGKTRGSGAAKGAGAGAAVGGVLGLVAGLTSLAIPGLGPIIAAGPIAAALAGAGIGAVAGGVIGALTKQGVPEEDAHYYAEGVKRGGTLITVRADDDTMADCVARTMKKHGAVDIDARAAEWQREGWNPPTGRSMASGTMRGESLPVVNEELIVGKRAVSHGGVRVYTHVTETPVDKKVKLREEHVDVERRPVDRPLGAGEDAFRERTLEARETSEEPVVQKRARVVEEVDLKKQASEREQSIHDTVRKTDVKVDRTGDRPTRSGRAAYDGPERRVRARSFKGLDRRNPG
jgi:uncharacterized protein (TIGR02271 family)